MKMRVVSWSKMSANSCTILIATASLVIVWLLCIWLIRRAMKRGHISYSGNRPGMPTRTYSRTEAPLGFWGGIIIILFVAAMCTLVALVFILGACGVNI